MAKLVGYGFGLDDPNSSMSCMINASGTNNIKLHSCRWHGMAWQIFCECSNWFYDQSLYYHNS